MAAFPRAIEPFYSLADPTAIPLYAGPLIYPSYQRISADQVDGSVWLQMEPPLQVHIRSPISLHSGIDELFGGMRAPQLPPMATVPGAPAALSGAGDASWLGPAEGLIAGKAIAVRRVTFHFANFKPMAGAYITDGVNA